jgi:carbamoyl-phosphate synthase large subunit
MNCNILISSAGRRVSLIRAFRESLEELNLMGQIFISDLNPKLAPAYYFADGVLELPRNSEKNYIEELIAQCLKFKISIIIPTIDTELENLAIYREKFSENGIEIIISSKELVSNLRDKKQTFKIFDQIGIPNIPTQNPPDFRFPVFYKPFNGSLSKGIGIAESVNQLSNQLLSDTSLIWTDYLDSNKYNEFTVDCYYSKKGDLITLVPRQRIETRGGEVSKAKTIKGSLFHSLNSKMSKLVGARGCITLQVFYSKDENELFGIEINPRFGGGYPLSFHAGANYPKLILQEYFLNQELSENNDWAENKVMIRFDQEIII